MAKKSGGYFGLGWVISVILAVIPVTSWICGLIITAQRNHWLFFLIRLVFGFNIIWLIDLICIVVYNKLKILI